MLVYQRVAFSTHFGFNDVKPKKRHGFFKLQTIGGGKKNSAGHPTLDGAFVDGAIGGFHMPYAPCMANIYLQEVQKTKRIAHWLGRGIF